MSDKHRITIVGVGDDGYPGLTRQARESIQTATTIYGSASLISQFPELAQEKTVLSSDLDLMAEELRTAPAGSVLLASGDPLFYGMARFLCDRLGKDAFEVIPHVSSMQLAFARVKESWEEAYLANVANQTIERIVERVRTSEKVGLFTTAEITPSRIAHALLTRGIHYFTAYICENLGAPDERVTRVELRDLEQHTFGPLNIVVLIRHNGAPDQQILSRNRRLFGNPDELFKQSRPKRGLLTPSEIRSVALSEMELKSDSIVWDIGAGSGSVAIEAALIAREGHVYAIEMDPEDYGLMVENAKLFGVSNLTGVLGQAPQAWQDLPDPDAIFVGGTGRTVSALVTASWQRLRRRGCLIVNMTSIENVSEVQRVAFTQWGIEPQVWMIQISRGNFQLESHRFETANPNFLIKLVKP